MSPVRPVPVAKRYYRTRKDDVALRRLDARKRPNAGEAAITLYLGKSLFGESLFRHRSAETDGETKAMPGLGLMRNGMQSKLRVLAVLLVLGGSAALSAGRMEAQEGKLAAAAPVTYDNRYEVYGGVQYMNFQAGQNVSKLMSLGGVEVSGTYWISSKWGAMADYRGAAGTSPVTPNILFNGNALVVLNTGMLGAQYRVAQNQRFAFAAHALAGVSHGKFDYTEPPENPPTGGSGFYTNRTKPMGAFGASLDYNRSKNLAFRFSPDLVLEHYGTETREFFAASFGVMYRFGSRSR